MVRVRGIQQRHKTFFARLVIPAELRPTMGGKAELRERLGTDRRQAERDVHAVMARFHDQIARARRNSTGKPPQCHRIVSLTEVAQTLYREGLATDDRSRNLERAPIAPHDSDELDHDLMDSLASDFPDSEVPRLQAIVAGRATDAELAAWIGHELEQLVYRGLLTCEPRTPDWRNAARTVAAVRLELIRRQQERDQGDFSGEPKLPILTQAPATEPAAPADAARITGPESLLTLREVAERMHKEKRNVRASTQGEQIIAIRMFDEFVGESVPVHKITRRMVINYKDALAETPVL